MMDEVYCLMCGWSGTADQTIAHYDDDGYIALCPRCGYACSTDEYEDDE